MSFERPEIALVLGAVLAVFGLGSVVLGSRGGRFRTLPGWAGFWIFWALLLAVLGRTPTWVALPLLGVAQFGALREYFFLAPLRPHDRWSILMAYASIGAVLVPVSRGSYGGFTTISLFFLFLILPALLSLARSHEGLLDSLGRVLLGFMAYVFAAAHLGWTAKLPLGHLELFGLLVIVAEFPQRLAGRLRLSNGVLRSLFGVLCSFAAGAAAGGFLGPWIGMTVQQGVAISLWVTGTVTVGGLVTDAVSRGLELGASSRLGRAALLDRITPAVYAAPLYYHYVDYIVGAG